MIKRYLTEENVERLKNHFEFLIKFILESSGEFDLAIRDGYFNIYYKGNSLAKVSFKADNSYHISINKKFIENTSANNDARFSKLFNINNDYYNINLKPNQLRPFLQKKHLKEFASRIKFVNYGEEISFEQSIIADNIDNEKVIFIDRQVSDKSNKNRLDLLALVQIKEDKYHFLVSEVKLGNNKDLKSKVVKQLNQYIEHINENFKTYQECYQKQYQQKRKIGLLNKFTNKSIEIKEPVEGIILVGGYSGLAKLQIEILKKKYKNIKVKHFTYKLHDLRT